MTLLSRLTAYLLLPLLSLVAGYLLFYRLGEGLLHEFALHGIAITLALLLAALPPLLFHFVIRSQLKEGFALLKDGQVVTPTEITLTDILGHRIVAWKLFRQHLDTEVCLQGDGELLYIKLGFDFSIPATEAGKRFVRHYQHNMTVFEAWVQRSIYVASCQDREMATHLEQETLLNEEDEKMLRHKFIYALRAQPLRSLSLPASSREIRLNREIRRREKQVSPEEELDLDTTLLLQLGLTPSG